MDNRVEVREFLMSRRAKITPDRVGLPTYGIPTSGRHRRPTAPASQPHETLH